MSAFFSRSPFLLVRPNRAKLLEAVEQLFYFGVITPAELERVRSPRVDARRSARALAAW
jgi:hypothetical protein